MDLRNRFWLLILVFMVSMTGCYHMRIEAEPIEPRVLTAKGQPKDAAAKIRELVEDKWKCRILETHSSGTVLITAPYHFTTDTGFGQPAGGRKYYTQLRIEAFDKSGITEIHISPYNFEIRSSYAYNNYAGGSKDVGALHKHYPYEEYPGMFDLNLINGELDRAAADIRRLFKEYR